jgi:hypothetical protein
MQRTDWKYFVDVLLFLSILGIMAIGFLLGFVIPRGPSAAEDVKYFLGLHRHQWGNIHFYLALVFSVVLVIHLFLEWSWIKGKSRQLVSAGWPFLVGTVAAGACLVPLSAWLFLRVAGDPYVDERPSLARNASKPVSGIPEVAGDKVHQRETGIEVSGQMTLREIEHRTGVPAMDIAVALNLPRDVSFDETIGRLRKTYGFSMHDVRDVLTKAMARRKR